MDGVLKLSNVATVPAPKDVVCLKESNADEFLYEGVPFALQTGLIGIREGFFEHGKRPSFGKRQGGVAFLEISSHLSAQWFELVFCACFSGGGKARNAVDVGRVGTADVFDKP